MHTGHSVYATLHANTAEEVITRLTNPPIEIPKPMIASLSMIVIQNRNRRTGKRRTLQVAEITPTGDVRVLMKLNVAKDTLEETGRSQTMVEKLKLYTGMTDEEITGDIQEKVRILKWMVKKELYDVNEIGVVVSKYYMGTLNINY